MPDFTRREFIALVGAGGLLIAGRVKRAREQQAAMPVIGLCDSRTGTTASLPAVCEGLAGAPVRSSEPSVLSISKHGRFRKRCFDAVCGSLMLYACWWNHSPLGYPASSL